jgi:hypothetical protein
LNFLPEPHQHGSLRPVACPALKDTMLHKIAEASLRTPDDSCVT